MKNLIPKVLNLLGTLCFVPFGLSAAELNATISAPVPVPSGQVSVSATDSTKLPYGVADVVKLSRAQVSEDVIISYVQNSGSTYSLNSDDIVRLRNEGVSDRVINTILDQHKRTMEALPSTPTTAPVYADNVNSGVANVQQQPVEAPLAPASTSYVIPYPAATAAYYGYYRPYYSPYYCGPSYYGYPYYGYYGGPVFSFRFGFGGGRGGSWHGGHGGHGGGGHGHR